MRDIIFRGKRMLDGDWVEGNYLLWGSLPAIQDYSKTNGEIFTIDPSTIGEFTGYQLEKDPLLETCETGKQKLFEGDNVDFADFDDNGADRPRQGTVYWCDGAFWIDCTEKYGDEAIYSLVAAYAQDSCMRIIGNIHIQNSPPAQQRRRAHTK